MTRSPTARCRFLVATLLLAAYLGYVALEFREGERQAAAGESPFFNDFTSTYAASMLIRERPASSLWLQEDYYPAEIAAARLAYGNRISEAQARGHGYAAWLYPPLFILFILPLAAFPYLGAYVGWLLVTLIPYLAALRSLAPRGWRWPLLAGAPPTFFNIIYGQTGFLNAGLLGAGIAQIERRPTLAGVCIGLAAFKPQFGILIPFALAAGGHGWVFLSATVTVLALVAATVIAFGADPWFAFIGTQLRNFEGFAFGAYNLKAMVTPFATARTLTGSVESAWWIQSAVTLAVLGLVVWGWRFGRASDPGFQLRPALLTGCALLATPMAYLYDLTILVLCAGWLLAHIEETGRDRHHRHWIILLLLSTLMLKPVAGATGLQFGALVPLALVALTLLRWRRASLLSRVAATPS